MQSEFLIRHLHFPFVLALTAALFGQHSLLRTSLARRAVQQLTAFELLLLLAMSMLATLMARAIGNRGA